MLQIKQLKVKACRGILNVPELNIDKGGLILCGDNGTGKSSFVDAIEKVLVKKCGSIERHIAGLSWGKLDTHKKSASSSNYNCTTDGSTDYPINLDTNDASLPFAVKKLVEACKQESFIYDERAPFL